MLKAAIFKFYFNQFIWFSTYQSLRVANTKSGPKSIKSKQQKTDAKRDI